MDGSLKSVVWLGSSKKDLLLFPSDTIRDVGHALYIAQCGEKPSNAKPLKGFGGASVLEVVESHDRDAFRAVYTVLFEEAVYVLHCFQKKAKAGVATPKQDLELIKARLKAAEEAHKQWQEKMKGH